MFSIFSCFEAHSQQSPDFTFSGTDGKTRNLYTLLDSGNIVVLDFFFADCTPCQKLTPAMSRLNSDYQDSNQSIFIIGISDRDEDSTLHRFDSTYGVNYISCGVQGGGDTITQLYKSWFNFTGWPTYAVICNPSSIAWDLKREESFTEVRQQVSDCQTTNSLVSISSGSISLAPTITSGTMIIKSQTSFSSIQVSSINGVKTEVGGSFNPTTKTAIDCSNLKPGIYILTVSSRYDVFTTKFIKTNK